ncbi:MAG TPA: hypothetical protein ENL15_00125, partial [Firmicutes bacterium]|nr:hypothetical protein [Bacillota bacterium]
MKTLQDLFLQNGKLYETRKALQIFRDGAYKSYTYGQYLDYALKLGSFLRELGYEKGERVGVLGNNSPEWAMVYAACLLQGFIAVPIDRLLGIHEIIHIINDSDMRGLFAEGKFYEAVTEAKKEMPALKDIYELNYSGETGFYSLLEKVREIPELPDVDPEDPAVFLYTSGTTGKTKGVILTHKNLVSNLLAIRERLQIQPEDNLLSILPLHHAYEGTAGFLTPIFSGSLITFSPSLANRDIVRSMAETGVTKMVGVPLIFEKMYNSIQSNISKLPPAKKAIVKLLFLTARIRRLFDKSLNGTKGIFKPLLEKAGFQNIDFFVAGGAALPPHINKFFFLLGIPIIQGYGLTETSPVLSAVDPRDVDFYSVGRPLKGVKVRIYNPDETGVGEIVVRGDNIMKGYYKEPGKTAEVLKQGWFYTGDYGFIDKKGRINIKGRLKNVIVSSGGKNIYPEEIEEILI